MKIRFEYVDLSNQLAELRQNDYCKKSQIIFTTIEKNNEKRIRRSYKAGNKITACSVLLNAPPLGTLTLQEGWARSIIPEIYW